MKSFLILILLLSGTMLLTADIDDSYEAKDEHYSELDLSPEQQIILERIELRLAFVQDEFSDKLSKSEMKRLQNTLRELRQLILKLATPEPVSYRPMNKKDFADLKQRIRKLAFPDDGLTLLKTAATGNYFTSAQIAGLLDQFTFPDDKLKALQITYPACVDTSGNYKILDCFIFGDDKEKARAIIEK